MANNHQSIMMSTNSERTLSSATTTATNRQNSATKMKKMDKNDHHQQPVNIVINFLDESKTVFQIHVSFFFFFQFEIWNC